MSYQMSARPGRSGSTSAAAILHFFVSGLAVLVSCLFLLLSLVASSSSTVSGSTKSALAVLCAFILAIALGMIFVGVMFWRGRPWARWTLVVIYSLSTVSAVSKLGSGGTVSIGLIIDVVMLILLFLPSTADDFKPRPFTPAAYPPAAFASGPQWQAPGYVPAPAPMPAGWYPDPRGGGGLRYWSGQGWTEHTSAQPTPPTR